jgi:CobQ-like glutamine amidotransferase family enzyme
MSKQLLRILQLYPKDMNIYGDWGNVLTLQRRAQWHGYDVQLLEYNPGDVFPKRVDLVVGGGGQDSGQLVVQNDLAKIGPELKTLAEAGTPMLVICGLYQLFGNFFKTKDGEIIQGIGIFDIETHGGPERLIGNIVTHSDEFGDIVGYENHSGLTYLSSGMQPLGKVIKGAGNNGQDEFEGARLHSVIGSYLHGSLLPKNPMLADWLIEQAAIKKYGEAHLTIIDDSLANAARDVAIKRPR